MPSNMNRIGLNFNTHMRKSRTSNSHHDHSLSAQIESFVEDSPFPSAGASSLPPLPAGGASPKGALEECPPWGAPALVPPAEL